MRATEQHFPVELFIMRNKIFLAFESVDESLKCDHSNEWLWATFSCGYIHSAPRVVLSFEYVDENLKYNHLNESLTERYFPKTC